MPASRETLAEFLNIVRQHVPEVVFTKLVDEIIAKGIGRSNMSVWTSLLRLQEALHNKPRKPRKKRQYH